ncbi:fused response regulator/phosphatase [bacterium]|nr:fused response regulator/phosphatase [bacterium]
MEYKTAASNETILIIDDQNSIRTSLRLYLEDYGYTVDTAENGKIGIEKFNKIKPDLVILDIRMPVMSGTEVLEILHIESPATPVIVISGTGLIKDCISALQNGAQDFIMKPLIDMSLFLHRVKKVLCTARIKREHKKYQINLENTLKQIQLDEETAKRIQLKLLPEENQNIHDFNLSFHFMPSRCLSGDFVDYVNVDENHIVFYSADVSGHGISSALVTVLLKGFMKMHFENYNHLKIDTILKPDQLLNALNRELLAENLEKHITLFYGVIDISKSLLKYGYAGQYPFPVIWEHGKCEFIKGKGFPIGLFPYAEYEVYEKKLSDNFRLSVFSDGIIDILEQQNNKDKIAFLKTLQSDELLNNFVNQLMRHEPFPDDVTILTITRGQDNG